MRLDQELLTAKFAKEGRKVREEIQIQALPTCGVLLDQHDDAVSDGSGRKRAYWGPVGKRRRAGAAASGRSENKTARNLTAAELFQRFIHFRERARSHLTAHLAGGSHCQNLAQILTGADG
jgi:hypothetical protein